MAACADALGWRSVGTAILLNEWIGQREGDVLALPRPDASDGTLAFRQGKRHRRVALPVHLVGHLVARLRAEGAHPGAVLHPARLLLRDDTGRPWHDEARGADEHAFLARLDMERREG